MRRLATLVIVLFAACAMPAAAQDVPPYPSPEWEEVGDDATVTADDWGDAGVPEQDAPFPSAAPQQPEEPEAPVQLPFVQGTVVRGRIARLRSDGRAAIPRGAPKTVRNAIRAANAIVGKPYKWGGGHGSLIDRGYDCSGAVGYALIGARMLGGPMVSGQFARWGGGGDGRWVSIYANAGHVYMEIAGLRLDTSPVGDPTGRMGVRWRPLIGRRPGFHARHPVGY
jgi:hypothetical protein